MSGPWEIWNRIMIVVGTVATVIGAIVAVYALVSPADLTQRLAQIVSRLELEPALSESDRFVMVGISCSLGDDCGYQVGKSPTQSTGTMTVTFCKPGVVDPIYFAQHGFGRNEDTVYQNFTGDGDELWTILRVATSNGSFSILENWRSSGKDYSSWLRTAAPAVYSDTLDYSSNLLSAQMKQP